MLYSSSSKVTQITFLERLEEARLAEGAARAPTRGEERIFGRSLPPRPDFEHQSAEWPRCHFNVRRSSPSPVPLSLSLSVPTFPCRSCPHWVFSCFCRLTLYKSRQSVKAAMTPLKRHRQHPETAKARRLCMSVEAAVLVSRPTKKEAGNSVRGLGTPNSCQSVATSVTRGENAAMPTVEASSKHVCPIVRKNQRACA